MAVASYHPLFINILNHTPSQQVLWIKEEDTIFQLGEERIKTNTKMSFLLWEAAHYPAFPSAFLLHDFLLPFFYVNRIHMEYKFFCISD